MLEMFNTVVDAGVTVGKIIVVVEVVDEDYLMVVEEDYSMNVHARFGMHHRLSLDHRI